MKKSINYGSYSRNEWNGVVDVNDPLFKQWKKAVLPVLQDYELWIYGGVLEPEWLSYDIDGSIIGPYDPVKINQVLEDIVRISFEYGIFPDIKYTFDGKLFNWSDWRDHGNKQTIKYAYYKGMMWVNNKLIEWGTSEDGLWTASRTWPMIGTLNKNHNYSDPVKLS